MRGVGRRMRFDSTAAPVELDLTVLDIWNADVKSESFCAKLKIRARWVCPSEHAEEAMQEGGDGLDTDWEPEWFPRMVVTSSTETKVEHQSFVAQKEEGSSIVKITGDWTFNVHILEAYDLHAFPFDVQDFNIVVRMENAAMRLELKALPDLSKRGGEHTRNRHHKAGQGPKVAKVDDRACPVRVESAGLELPDFRTLHDRTAEHSWLESPALYRVLPDNNEVQIVLLYERNPLFYILNYMLLLFGITSCVAFAWAVPWQQVQDRLSLDVTLLLTSIAFKQVLAGTVPPISYLTRLDAYALGSLFFLLLATAMHAVIGFMIDYCDDNGLCTFFIARFSNGDARATDSVFLWTWIGTWFFSNLGYAVSVVRRLERGRSAFSITNARQKGFAPAEVPKMDEMEWYEEQPADRDAGSSEKQHTPLTAGV